MNCVEGELMELLLEMYKSGLTPKEASDIVRRVQEIIKMGIRPIAI